MPNETYTLKYTAEQINHRLDLINENKNLLPYPYKYDTILPLGLEDVGDGSFLTTTDINSTTVTIKPKDNYSIPKGTYTISIEVTDVMGTHSSNSGFSLQINDKEYSSGSRLTLSSETIITTVSLKIPSNTAKNLLIKPQIEKGTTQTAWVPYMDKIGNYVDERFNGVNTKLKGILEFMNLVEIVDAQ